MGSHRSQRTVRAVAAIAALAVVAVTGCGSDDAADVDDTFDLEVVDDAPAQPPDDDPDADPGDADPGDAEEPADPADPADPDDPGDADPGDAEDPGDADPGDAEDPADPADPADPDPDAEAPAVSIIDDGRHPAYLTDIDLDEGTITFDVIQFFTGDEAIAAYREDEPEDPGGEPPNDYHIRNVNPLLRTLPVSASVTVTIVTPEVGSSADPVPSSFAALPAHLAARSGPPGQLGWLPFWLTVEDDVVLVIEEQFLP